MGTSGVAEVPPFAGDSDDCCSGLGCPVVVLPGARLLQEDGCGRCWAAAASYANAGAMLFLA